MYMRSSFFFFACVVGILALTTPVVTGYCDTNAKSKRDCLLCKVSLQDATQSECEDSDVGGPCFWTDGDSNPYEDWTDANCVNGGGGGSGGGGGGGVCDANICDRPGPCSKKCCVEDKGAGTCTPKRLR